MKRLFTNSTIEKKKLKTVRVKMKNKTNEAIPNDSVVQFILNYSKAYSVISSGSLKSYGTILN